MSPLSLSRRGSSLVFGIFLFWVISSVTVGLIFSLVPRSRDIRGIERGNQAFYQAESGVEKTLFELSRDNPAAEPALSSGSATTAWFASESVATGPLFPVEGTGDSSYDRNWARLSIDRPISLDIPVGKKGPFLDQFMIRFRVPNLDSNSGTLQYLSGGLTQGVIQWTLTMASTTGVIRSLASYSGSWIHANNINASELLANWPTTRVGKVSDTFKATSSTGVTIDSFRFASRDCTTPGECTLKLALLIKPVLTTGQEVPFLEYQVTGSGLIAPYTILTSEGYFNGYRKSITRTIPHRSTLGVLDYASVQ